MAETSGNLESDSDMSIIDDPAEWTSQHAENHSPDLRDFEIEDQENESETSGQSIGTKFPKECQVCSLSMYEEIKKFENLISSSIQKMETLPKPHNKASVEQLIDLAKTTLSQTHKFQELIEQYTHIEHGIPQYKSRHSDANVSKILADAMKEKN